MRALAPVCGRPSNDPVTMRIAIWHNLPSGGGKRALHDHVRYLVDAGHHVEAWAPPTRDPDYLPLSSMIAEHIVPLDHPVRYTLAEKLQLRRYAGRVARHMEAHCRQVASAVDAGGFDVLFANSCQFLRTTPVGRFARTPSALYLQEPYRWLYEAMPDLIWAAPTSPDRPSLAAAKTRFVDVRDVRNARLQVREEIANARAFNRILCNSFFSRESILRAYGLDAEVCYLGIDASRFAPRNGPRESHVVGLGAFTREKNPRLCIEALSRMPVPRPTLRWIGNVADPAYLAEMTALASRCGVALDVVTRVSDDELLDTLGGALAMIYAPRLEPFGLAPLEANACGTPVVAVPEGGVRETVIDGINGLLVPGYPDRLAEALGRLVADPAFAERLGRQGRALVRERWSHASAGERLVAALERVAAAPEGEAAR